MAAPVLRWMLRKGRLVVVTLIGFVLIAVGGVLLVFPPIPGLPVIIAGFALLSIEYVWARRAMQAAKRRWYKQRDRYRAYRLKRRPLPAEPTESTDG